MIFVTVGSMLPFDRLIQAMDRWAAEHPAEDVRAQIGEGALEPLHVQWRRMLSPAEFRDHVRSCEVIVAHAGMGSVFSAAEAGKPIVLLPRRLHLGEHTTEHQAHSASWLKHRAGIFVAEDEGALPAALEDARNSPPASGFGEFAPAAFSERIRQFILHTQ